MVPKKASLDGKSRQEAYGSIGSKSEITSNCRPASATGTEARLEEIVLTLELVVGATMLLQPRSKAGIFIGLPIPIPVPVFYGPAYYPSWVLLRTVLCSADIGGTDAGHAATGGIIFISVQISFTDVLRRFQLNRCL
jgi:hypothetical protein